MTDDLFKRRSTLSNLSIRTDFPNYTIYDGLLAPSFIVSAYESSFIKYIYALLYNTYIYPLCMKNNNYSFDWFL